MPFFQELQSLSSTSFPLINRAQLKTWHANLQKHISTVARLQRFSNAQADLNQFKTMESISKALLSVFDQSDADQNIYALITKLADQDDTVLAYTVSELADFLMHELRHEKQPLAALTDLLGGINCPIHFAAFILCLLRKNIPAQDILTSGILHQSFQNNCHDMQQVTEIYRLLSLGSKEFDPAKTLLQEADLVSPAVNSLEYYTLNGTPQKTIPSTIQTNKPLFTFTPTIENWEKLYALFEDAFLLQVLLHSNPKHDDLLSNALKQMNISELTRLYQFVSTGTAKEIRLSLLEKLARYIPHEKQYAVLISNRVSKCLMFTANPDLMTNVDAEALGQIIQEALSTRYDIPYAASLCKQSAFKPWRHIIYRAMFDLLLNDPQLIIDEDILDDMTKHHSIHEWCHKISDALLQELRSHIAININPFTLDSYIHIQDQFQLHRPKIDAMNLLLVHNRLSYPKGIHELKALILQSLFHTMDGQTLSTALDIMHSHESNNTSYTADHVKNGKINTLYQCLCFIDDADLQIAIIELLKEKFSIENWMAGQLSTTSILQQALLNNNHALIRHYIPEGLSDEQQLLQLKNVSQHYSLIKPKPQFNNNWRGTDELLHFIVVALCNTSNSTPQALQHVLMLYPEVNRFDIVTAKQDHHAETFILRIAQNHPRALLSMLETLPAEKQFAALNNWTLNDAFQGGRDVINGILAILSRHPNEEEVIAALANYHIFRLIIKDIDTLKAIHTAYPNFIYQKLTKDLTVLSRLKDNLESVTLLLKTLPLEERKKAVMEQFFISRDTSPELLRAIFAAFSSDERSNLLKAKDEFKRTALHGLAGTHLSLQMALDVLPPEEQIAQLEVKDHIGSTPLHYALGKWESVKIILSVYETDKDQLKALKNTNKMGENMFHRVAHYTCNSLQVMLEVCKKCNNFDALYAINNEGNTPLHLATTYAAFLKLMLEAIPQENRLSALTTIISQGQSVLQLALRKNNTVPLVALLSVLPIDQRFPLIAPSLIAIQNLIFDAPNEAGANAILIVLSPEHRFEFVKLHFVSFVYYYPDVLKTVLSKKIAELDSIEPLQKQPRLSFFAEASKPEIQVQLESAKELGEFQAVLDQLSSPSVRSDCHGH